MELSSRNKLDFPDEPGGAHSEHLLNRFCVPNARPTKQATCHLATPPPAWIAILPLLASVLSLYIPQQAPQNANLGTAAPSILSPSSPQVGRTHATSCNISTSDSGGLVSVSLVIISEFIADRNVRKMGRKNTHSAFLACILASTKSHHQSVGQ